MRPAVRVYAVGVSSGAALALEAAASGARIQKLAVYEPPFMADERQRRAKPITRAS